MLVSPTRNVATNNPGTSAVTATLLVPTGIVVQGLVTALLLDLSAGAQTYFLLTSLAQADTTPSATVWTLAIQGGGAVVHADCTFPVETNTSAQVRYRIDASTSDHSVYLSTQGWIDRRGQDAA